MGAATTPQARTARHGVATKAVTAGLSTSMVLALVAVLADQATANQEPTVAGEPAGVDLTVDTGLLGAGLAGAADAVADDARVLVIQLDIPDIPRPQAPPSRSAQRSTSKSSTGAKTSTKKATKKAKSSTKRSSTKRTAQPKPKPAVTKQSG